jgi:PAS domain S-box-containing protein
MTPLPKSPKADLLLAAIVDSSEDAIVSKDLHSIVTSWNKAAERLFGYTAPEMIGQSISRMFPADRLDEEPDIMSRIQRGERVEHFETVRIRKNGVPIHVSLTISPIRDRAGEIIGASKIARDITSLIQGRQELAAAHEELKRADQLKMEFLATLSHELRTPLNAILLWVQILKGQHSAAELAEGVNIIERNVRAQAQLIEDLLDMSRIEAGKVSLDMQRLDLSAVAVAAMETVRPAANAKGIQLISKFASIRGGVMGDRNRFQQILWNLLINAIKFTPKDGKITVAIDRVESHIEISVTDTGQGVAPEMLGQIFERFRQADASITRKHGGLGLGLSIAKNLTELHGGTIRAESRGLGQGAAFIVSLPLMPILRIEEPLAIEDQEAVPDRVGRAPALKGVRVLVVDDDMDALRIVRRILERREAEVCITGSMEEALAEFARCRPHVILSDIGMPVHDGYELITRLRTLPDARNIPAVALTALARVEDRTRALHAGFQMHLAKPVDAEELVAVVHNLASLRRS